MKKLFVLADSISMHYGPFLEQYIKGTFEYDRKGKNHEFENLDIASRVNGGDSSNCLDYLELFPNTEFDVLLLNCGLHDIKRAIPEKLRQKGSHPAKRVFQAIRIEVNSELEPLKKSLGDFFDCLAPGGRLAVISFHSLEDRIVKKTFQSFLGTCTCPKDFPICVCGKKARGKLITAKPILPSEEEIAYNKRSKSAKLRVCEKL